MRTDWYILGLFPPDKKARLPQMFGSATKDFSPVNRRDVPKFNL